MHLTHFQLSIIKMIHKYQREFHPIRVRIIENDDNHNNETRTIIDPIGHENSSVVVRTILNEEDYNNHSSTYQNDVMDI